MSNKNLSRNATKIIEFVKNHEILYNTRHPDFRNAQAKYRLWSKLANDLYADVDAVRRKWVTMRDYFVRNQTRKSYGKPAPNTKRDELMMFLLDKPTLKRTSRIKKKLIELSTPKEENSDTFIKSEIDLPESELTYENDEKLRIDLDVNEALESRINEFSDSRTSSMVGIETDGHSSTVSFETPLYNSDREKINAPSPDPTDVLYKMLTSHKPHPVPPISKPKDNLDYFFESLASTMRTFPALSVAKLKLKMSQLVGEEEVSLARQAQSTPSFIMNEAD